MAQAENEREEPGAEEGAAMKGDDDPPQAQEEPGALNRRGFFQVGRTLRNRDGDRADWDYRVARGESDDENSDGPVHTVRRRAVPHIDDPDAEDGGRRDEREHGERIDPGASWSVARDRPAEDQADRGEQRRREGGGNDAVLDAGPNPVTHLPKPVPSQGAPSEADDGEHRSGCCRPAGQRGQPAEAAEPERWPLLAAQAQHGERAPRADAPLDREERQRHGDQGHREYRCFAGGIIDRAEAGKDNGRICPDAQEHGDAQFRQRKREDQQRTERCRGHATGSTMRTATFQGGAQRRPASSIDGSMACTASATSAVTIGVKAMVSTPIAPAEVNSASG